MLGQVKAVYPEAFDYEPAWWADPSRQGQRVPSVRVMFPLDEATGTRTEGRHPLAARQETFRSRLLALVAVAHEVHQTGPCITFARGSHAVGLPSSFTSVVWRACLCPPRSFARRCRTRSRPCRSRSCSGGTPSLTWPPCRTSRPRSCRCRPWPSGRAPCLRPWRCGMPSSPRCRPRCDHTHGHRDLHRVCGEWRRGQPRFLPIPTCLAVRPGASGRAGCGRRRGSQRRRTRRCASRRQGYGRGDRSAAIPTDEPPRAGAPGCVAKEGRRRLGVNLPWRDAQSDLVSRRFAPRSEHRPRRRCAGRRRSNSCGRCS